MSAKSKRQEAEYRGVSSHGTGRLSPEKDEIGRVGKPRVTYTPRDDASPEGELTALAAVYRFVLRHHEKKKDAGVGEGEEAAERNRTEGTVSKERN